MWSRRHRALRGSVIFLGYVYPWLSRSAGCAPSAGVIYDIATPWLPGWAVLCVLICMWVTGDYSHSAAPRLCAGCLVGTSLLRGSVAGSLSDLIAHSAAPGLCAGWLVGTVWWTHRHSAAPGHIFFILLPFPLFFLSYGIILVLSQERFREETVFTFSPFFSPGAYYFAYVNQLF